MKLTQNAKTVLEKRYYKKNNQGELQEDWNGMINRVSNNIAQDNHEKAERYFKLLNSGAFLPNSPTLMNAGNDLQQLSACFVLPVEDSMESIFTSIKNAALIHKSGGGTGFSFSRLREADARVRTTNGVSSGPLTFLKVFNAATDAVKQGGTRRGANMAILSVTHPQILEFIKCKENTSELTNFNLSVGITEDFMRAVMQDEEYELISPHTKEIHSKLKAKEVFSLIVEMAHKNGEPGIVFLDRINEHNPTPHIGEIESTNPCFHPDTRISTDKGLVKICDLYSNDSEFQVFTDDRVINEKIEINKRDYYVNGTSARKARVLKTGTKKTIEISLKNGQALKVTPDHKIFTTSGWLEAENLKINDEVLVQSGKGSWEINDNIGNDLGLLIGWALGDGWLTADEKVLGMVFAENEEYILNVLRPIAENYNAGKGTLNQRENACWQILYKTNEFIKLVKEIGVKGLKAHQKRIPESFFTAKRETVSAMLNGLFSADGTVNHIDENHRDIRLTSTSFIMLQDVQLLLLNEGIYSKIYERTHSETNKFTYLTQDGELKIYDSKPYYELIINGNDIPAFIDFIPELLHKEKNEKMHSINKESRKNTKFISEVVAINPAEETEVYDIQEEVTHSLIANGLVVHNCGEQPLLPNEACNLGSINLVSVITDNKINWEYLKEVVRDSVDFLDDVIDKSKFPLPEIDEMVKANRKIGLGIMGWAEILYMLDIPYNSDKAIDLAKEIMEFIDYHGKERSMELAIEKGSFPNFKGSSYDKGTLKRTPYKKDWNSLIKKIKKNGIRNATITTIAPTGTISMICNTSSGIEPQFSLVYIKQVMDGEKLLYINDYLEKTLKEANLFEKSLMERIAEEGSLAHIEEIPQAIKDLFVTSHDISPEWHIKMQAAFQDYTDNAVSKTINFPNTATKEDIQIAFETSWKLGCKGVTVYRDGSRENQVLHVGNKTNEEKQDKTDRVSPRIRPEVTSGITQRIETGCGHLYVTINSDDLGPCEVFVQMGKVGGCASAQLEALARLASLSLRANVKLESIIRQLKGIRCPSPMWYKGKMITSCADAISLSLETFLTVQERGIINGSINVGDVKKISTGAKSNQMCPDCGCTIEHAEGCLKCNNCGWSKC